jgi:hypothetical protein
MNIMNIRSKQLNLEAFCPLEFSSLDWITKNEDSHNPYNPQQIYSKSLMDE